RSRLAAHTSQGNISAPLSAARSRTIPPAVNQRPRSPANWMPNREPGGVRRWSSGQLIQPDGAVGPGQRQGGGRRRGRSVGRCLREALGCEAQGISAEAKRRRCQRGMEWNQIANTSLYACMARQKKRGFSWSSAGQKRVLQAPSPGGGGSIDLGVVQWR